MKSKIPLLARQIGHQSGPFLKWRGLQTRMTLLYVGVTVGMLLFLQIVHWIIIIFVQSMSVNWNQMMLPDAIIFSLIAGLFGILTTQGIIKRLNRIAAATTGFATGQYDQLLPVTAADEIGQLEAHFNHMAEQLVLHLAREKQLVEQNARLEERTRLSRDLHDSVKQQVFALAVQIELARSLLAQDSPAAREHLDFADELSYQIQQELTTLIGALRPADLQAKGLITALRDYVTAWSRQCGIVVDLSLPEMCLLPSSIEEALWRVTQEALSNVARHSGASTVCLHLECTVQYISLSLSDNGQGFKMDLNSQRGVGMQSMHERIGQVGGTILIRSTRGVGTHVIIRCPLLQIKDDGPSEGKVIV